MSKHEARKILDAVNAFNQSSLHSAIDFSFTALKHRDLGQKHMEQLAAALKGMRDKTELVLWSIYNDTKEANPNCALSDWDIRFAMMYMGIMKNGDEPTDVYVPMMSKVDAAMGRMWVFTRHFPFFIHSQHVEFRHIQRTGKLLDYKDIPFLTAIGFSLLLARALEPDFRDAEEGFTLPVVIPHPQGLFLGSAEKVPRNFFIHPEAAMRIRGQYMSEDKETLLATWLPTVLIRARSFISHRELSNNQRLLWDNLLSLVETSKGLECLERFVDAYIIGNEDRMLKPNEKQSIQNFLNALRQIIEDHSWREEARIASRNIGRGRSDGHSPGASLQ